MCYVACFDFIRNLFISLLLYYPFPFFFFFLSSPPPQVSYPFFLFISIVCIPYYVVIFLHNFYNFYQAAVTVEINILLICFCSFDLFCPELDRMNEWNALFNDALNTVYLRLYGVRHLVKDHSDSEKGNPLPLHGLLFLINSKGSFICTIPQTG